MQKPPAIPRDPNDPSALAKSTFVADRCRIGWRKFDSREVLAEVEKKYGRCAAFIFIDSVWPLLDTRDPKGNQT